MPRGRGLPGRVLLSDQEGDQFTPVRSGRDGVTHPASRHGLITGGTPQHYQVARLRIKELSLFDWAVVMGERPGLGIRHSDAGTRTQLATSLWPSRAAAVKALTGPLLPVFKEFVKPGKRTSEVYPLHDGCVLAGGNVLTHPGIVRAYGSPGDADLLVRAAIDQLAEQRVVRRGLVLRCAECGDLDFHPIDGLGQQNTCSRCGHPTPLSHPAWNQPDEPRWVYGLHPAVARIVTQDGGIVPLHLAARLQARKGFAADMAEIEALRDGRPVAECDLVALIDGRLVIAEVKKTGRLRPKERSELATKLTLLATRLRADEILLATADPAWDATPDAVRQEMARGDWPTTPQRSPRPPTWA